MSETDNECTVHLTQCLFSLMRKIGNSPGYGTVLHMNHIVCDPYDGRTVGDHDHCFVFCKLQDSLTDQLFAFDINIGGRLIKYIDRCIMQ